MVAMNNRPSDHHLSKRLFIGYTSALYFWLRGSQGAWSSEACRASSIARCAYQVSDVQSFPYSREAFGPEPLHIMVDAQEKRRGNEQQKSHVWTIKLPERSFVDIGRGMFVASPALCFLQAATTLTLFSLIELGYELCGGYSRTPGIGSGFFQRSNVLVRPDQIRKLVNSLSSVPGSRKAALALRYVLPNSKSPAETDMAIKMVLPVLRGGYGLPLAELNAEIPTTPEASAIAQRNTLFPDMLWRKKGVCLEYDSRIHHERASDRTRDSLKRNALGCMGYKVITVTPSQLKSVTAFDGIASEVARYLGVRIRTPNPKAAKQRFELNEAIKRRISEDFTPIEWPYA